MLLPIITAVALNAIVIVTKISAGTVSCFYEVSCELVFASVSFFISFKYIYAMHYLVLILYLTPYYYHLGFKPWWYESKGYRPDW